MTAEKSRTPPSDDPSRLRRPLPRGELESRSQRTIDAAVATPPPRSPRRRRRGRRPPGLLLRTTYTYVLVEVVRIFVMSVLAISLIGTVLLAFQLTRSGIRIGFLWPILQKSLAYPLFFSMPVSLLFGITLGLGRLAGDLELNALKACGVSYRQIAAPLLALAVLLTGASLYINGEVIPEVHYQKGNLRDAIVAQLEDLGSGRNRSLLLPGDVRLFVKAYQGNRLRGIKLDLDRELLERLRDNLQQALLAPMGGRAPEASLTVMANRCDLVISPDRKQVFLNLHEVEILIPEWTRDRSEDPGIFRQKYAIKSLRMPLSFLEKGERDKDRNWKSLLERQGELEQQIETRREELASLGAGKLPAAPTSSSPDSEVASLAELDASSRRRLLEHEVRTLTRRAHNAETELHRRGAFGLACFSFAFVGIPLVFLADRRGRLVPFFLGNILVVLPFFLLVMLGIFLGERGIFPALSLALPNVALVGLGVFLWIRALKLS